MLNQMKDLLGMGYNYLITDGKTVGLYTEKPTKENGIYPKYAQIITLSETAADSIANLICMIMDEPIAITEIINYLEYLEVNE